MAIPGAAFLTPPTTRRAGSTLLLAHATVITPGRATLQDATIAIAGEQIEGVYPAGSAPSAPGAVSLRGRYVIPGLFDVHHHLASGLPSIAERKENTLRELPDYGITSVFDPGDSIARFIRLKQASADPQAARFFAAGPMLTAPGGHEANRENTVRSAREARDKVRRLRELRVDAVKFVYDDASWIRGRRLPVLSREAACAIVEEAHAQGLRAFVHAPMLPFAKEALRMGADALLHGIVSGPVDAELLALLRRNGACYVPTSALYEAGADIGGWIARAQAFGQRRYARLDNFLFRALFRAAVPRWNWLRGQLAVARLNLKAIHDAGVPVALGTDSGPPGLVSGWTTWLELKLYVEAGLTPAQALRAATLDAARMLGKQNELGSIEPGKLADLVVLDANPLEDIANIRRVHRVVRGGRIHRPRRIST